MFERHKCSKCGKWIPRNSHGVWDDSDPSNPVVFHEDCSAAVPTSTVATKTIKLSFEVPAEIDLASEDLALMRELLLDGLRYRAERFQFTPQKRRLIDALLTES